MTSLRVAGQIVSNDDATILDWVGLEGTSPSAVSDMLKKAKGEPVEFLINSHGGDVHAAAEMYADIQRYKGETTAIITGLAASAATVIALACDKVRAYPMAQMMIHNVSTVAIGDHKEMETAKQSLETADAGLRAIYTRKTGKSMDELRELMDAETWFSAQTALEAGLIDEIVDSEVGAIPLAANVSTVDIKKLRDAYVAQKIDTEPEEVQTDEQVSTARLLLDIEEKRFDEAAITCKEGK